MAPTNFRQKREKEKKEEPKPQPIVSTMISAGQYYPEIPIGTIFYKKTIPYKARLENIIIDIGKMSMPEADFIITIRGANGDTIYDITVGKGRNRFQDIKVDNGYKVSIFAKPVEGLTVSEVEVSFLINRL